jgi:uncharacterized circularly permuted ATP-grasp superfamily protein
MLADSVVDQTPRMPYHEFYLDDFEPRPHYRPLWEHIRRMGQNALATKAQKLQLAMRTEGITFAVYSETEQGIERVWPFDLIPRIIPTADWAILESGLKQRVRALNLFLKDIYHQQRILKDGVISAQLIYQGRHFRHEIMGIDPPHDIYTHVGGIDIVRDDDGRYLILENNLRTPSGVSYMIANRVLQRRILPEFFTRYRVRRVEHYPALLLQALRHVSPRGKDQAEIVVLTPGIYNSAYFEHTFLAKEMGVELVEGRDLVVKNNVVYMKTTAGLQRVDVIYRRVDDEFLDPLCFRSDSLLGVAGIINAWRAGNVAIVNAPGSGIADDKAIYPFVPKMWQGMNELWWMVDTRLKSPLQPERAAAFYASVRDEVARFHGLTSSTMMRGEAYGFYSLGTFVERAGFHEFLQGFLQCVGELNTALQAGAATL